MKALALIFDFKQSWGEEDVEHMYIVTVFDEPAPVMTRPVLAALDKAPVIHALSYLVSFL